MVGCVLEAWDRWRGEIGRDGRRWAGGELILEDAEEEEAGGGSEEGYVGGEAELCLGESCWMCREGEEIDACLRDGEM